MKTDEELCAYFTDLQEAFDCVNWTKLLQILKETAIDWRERRLVGKLYLDQNVRVRLDQEGTRSVKTGKIVRRGYCSSLILFNLYSQYLTNEVKDFGYFKIGQAIRTVKYADEASLLAKEENVLQGMIDRLIEIGRR